MQEELGKHTPILRDREHEFVAERLIQDATQMVTASCDAGNTISDYRRFSIKHAWCTRPHRANTRSQSAAWNSCGTIRSLTAVRDRTWRRTWSCCSQKPMPCVRCVRQADVTCGRLQCMTPCRKRVAEVASQLAAEAARASTSWHHRRHIVQNLGTVLHQKVIHHHK